MESNTGTKRKRQTGGPRIIYKTPERRFDRLFKEDSLLELHLSLKKKLQLPENSMLTLVQWIDGEIVDLEDEDDFDAFYDLAHSSSNPVQINITVVDKGTPSTLNRSANGEPPAKKQKTAPTKASSKTTTVAQPAAPTDESQSGSQPQGQPTPGSSSPAAPSQPPKDVPQAAPARPVAPTQPQPPQTKAGVTAVNGHAPPSPSPSAASGARRTPPPVDETPVQTAADVSGRAAKPSEDIVTGKIPATETNQAKTNGTTAKKTPGRKAKGREKEFPASNAPDVAPPLSKEPTEEPVSSPPPPEVVSQAPRLSPSTTPSINPTPSAKASVKPGFKLIKTQARHQTPEQLNQKIRKLKNLNKKISSQQAAIELKRRQFHAQSPPGPAQNEDDDSGTSTDNGTRSLIRSPERGTAIPIPTIPDQQNDRAADTDSGLQNVDNAHSRPELELTAQDLSNTPKTSQVATGKKTPFSLGPASFASLGNRSIEEDEEMDQDGEIAEVPSPSSSAMRVSANEIQAAIVPPTLTQTTARRAPSESSESSSEEEGPLAQNRGRPRLDAPPMILSAAALKAKKSPVAKQDSTPRERSDSSSSEKSDEEASVTLALLDQAGASVGPSPEQRQSPRPEQRASPPPAEDPIESDEDITPQKAIPAPSSPISQFPPATPRGKRGLVSRMKDSTGQSPAKKGSQVLSELGASSQPPGSVAKGTQNGRGSAVTGGSQLNELQTPVPTKLQQTRDDSQPMSVAHWSTLDNPPDSPHASSSYGMVDELQSDHAGDRLDLTPQNSLFLPPDSQLQFPFSQLDSIAGSVEKKAKRKSPLDPSDSSEEEEEVKKASPPKGTLTVAPLAGAQGKQNTEPDSSDEEETSPPKNGSLPARLSQSQPRPSFLPPTTTPRTKTPYRRLSEMADTGLAFKGPMSSHSKLPPRRTPARPIKRPNFGNDEEEEDSSTDSSDEDNEPASHFPAGRRAGRPSQAMK